MSDVIRHFSAADRARVLAAKVGKPSGVLFEYGGASFNLVCVPTSRLLQLMDLQEAFDPSKEVSTDAMRPLLELVRDLLEQSASIAAPEDDPFDRGVFLDWFGAQPMLGLLTAVMPKIVDAAGVLEAQKPGNPQRPATSRKKTPRRSTRSAG